MGRIELNRERFIGDLPSKIGPDASSYLWRAYFSRVVSFGAALLALLLFLASSAMDLPGMKWVALGLILLPIPLFVVNIYCLSMYRQQAISFTGVDPHVRGRIPHGSPAFEIWKKAHQPTQTET